MAFALIILALGLLLVAAGPRRGNCNHDFVPLEAATFGDHHRGVHYRCEKCGIELEGNT